MRFWKMVLFSLTLISFSLLSSVFLLSAYSAEVTLAWDKNSQEVAGYKIYYSTRDAGSYAGTGLDQGDSPITIPIADLVDPENPQFTLTGLVTNTYRFAATAYDDSGNESGFSNEVFFTVDLVPAPIDLISTVHIGCLCPFFLLYLDFDLNLETVVLSTKLSVIFASTFMLEINGSPICNFFPSEYIKTSILSLS